MKIEVIWIMDGRDKGITNNNGHGKLQLNSKINGVFYHFRLCSLYNICD